MDTYVCDNVKYGIEQMLTYKEHPEYTCPTVTDERKIFLVYGQPGIGKMDQLNATFKLNNVPTIVLEVSSDLDVTTKRINAIQLIENAVFIIRHVHLLPQLCSDPFVRKFALNLSMIDSYIVGVSDVPYQSDLFFGQFQIQISMTLPPQSHLKMLHMHYFEKYQKHCIENKLDVVVSLSNDDYTWLSQSSDSCTPKDIHDFCSKVCYYASDTTLRTKEQTIITRDMLEDTDNKLMYDITGCGILSITDRETHKAQQVFDTMSGVGCVPLKKRTKQ